MEKEIFNSQSLEKSIESEVGRKKRHDIFAYDTRVIFTGDLGDNPRNKRLKGQDGTEYIVKNLRYVDGRGAVYDLMKVWV